LTSSNGLFVTSIGSFPPRKDASVEESIRNAIQLQLECGVDVLVDGQIRSDVVGIFAQQVGLKGKGLPYHVETPLSVSSLAHSITLPDLEVATSYAEDRYLKVHITGPILMAESCLVNENRPEVAHYQGDEGFRLLTLDLARTLTEEVRLVAAQADRLNIAYLQIDEPSLTFGADLALTKEALSGIASAWREMTGREVILHVCGDIGSIITELLDMPVDILSLENVYLNQLENDFLDLWQKSQKKLALGVVPVNNDKIPSPQHIAREVLSAQERYGHGRIVAITPACGLRNRREDEARDRLHCLVQAAQLIKQG